MVGSPGLVAGLAGHHPGVRHRFGRVPYPQGRTIPGVGRNEMLGVGRSLVQFGGSADRHFERNKSGSGAFVQHSRHFKTIRYIIKAETTF